MNKLELRIPPVALVLISMLLMWGVSRVVPVASFHAGWLPGAAVVLAVLGLAVSVTGVLAFRKAHTTVDPTRPGAASSVVSSGIYRVSRNPMYLGFLLVLAGWSLHLANVVALILLPAFVLYMTRFQIVPEERFLSEKFGSAYDDYQRRVRRWL